MTVADMPDPEGIYSSLLGSTNTNTCYVNVPNVWDGNGALIMLTEYQEKLQHNSIVTVNVYMKM